MWIFELISEIVNFVFGWILARNVPNICHKSMNTAKWIIPSINNQNINGNHWTKKFEKLSNSQRNSRICFLSCYCCYRWPFILRPHFQIKKSKTNYVSAKINNNQAEKKKRLKALNRPKSEEKWRSEHICEYDICECAINVFFYSRFISHTKLFDSIQWIARLCNYIALVSRSNHTKKN